MSRLDKPKPYGYGSGYGNSDGYGEGQRLGNHQPTKLCQSVIIQRLKHAKQNLNKTNPLSLIHSGYQENYENIYFWYSN